MGARGPKPETDIHVLPAPVNKRKSPMPGMTPAARTIWTRIVKAYPVDHFKPQHYGMLRAYCEEEATRDEATNELKKGKVSKNTKTGVEKQSPWVGIKNNANSAMCQIGTKLGITVNNTTAAKGQKGQGSKPKSKRGNLLSRG